MLNALLTPFKAGLSMFTRQRPQRPRASATDNNLTTPPSRTSRAVTFDIQRPPPDEESPPDFTIGGPLTSTSTRSQSDWRYTPNTKAGREGRKDLLTEITASAAKHGTLNFKQPSYEKLVDIVTMTFKRNGIYHLLEIPKSGTGRVWPALDSQAPLRIDLHDYSNILLDQTLTFDHVMAYVNLGAGAGCLELPADVNVAIQRHKPSMDSSGTSLQLALLQFDIQWISDLWLDVLVICFGHKVIFAMKYQKPSVVSIGVSDRGEHLEGLLILKKIQAVIMPPHLTRLLSMQDEFNSVSILTTSPEDLTHVMNEINRIQCEINEAAKTERITDADVALRIKDSIQSSKYNDFVSDTNKSYLKLEKGKLTLDEFREEIMDSFLLSSDATKPTALALVTERQNKMEQKLVKGLRGQWKQPPRIKTDQVGSHKASSHQSDKPSQQSDKLYSSKGTHAHVKGSKLDDHGDPWNPHKYNGVDTKFNPFANGKEGEWYHLCKQDHLKDRAGEWIKGSWMYCKAGHDHAEWAKNEKDRKQKRKNNKRNKPSSKVDTPTSAEKITPSGTNRLKLKQAFVSKSICLNGLAKSDAEKQFEEIMEEASSKE